jgi:hypothetical protein
MLPVRPVGLVVLCVMIFASLAVFADDAAAVPAFAEQTGQHCAACHIGGFGPGLTPFGREFKLSGYTLRAGSGFTTPLSAMVVASYVHTTQDQPPPPHYAPNDNVALDQVGLFVAGGVGDHFGGFAQFTYEGVGPNVAWDNLDLRAVNTVTLGGSQATIGLLLNNSPTVQDPWNTQSAWGFPYTDSDLVPAPDAAPVLEGGLSQSVLGTSAYIWWNSALYAEAGAYWSPGDGFLRAMGVDPDESGDIASVAPYFRIAYQKDYGNQNFEVGGIAFFPHLYPGGDQSTGTDDAYSDLGLDAAYQYMGTGDNIYELNARYTHEHQTLGASYLLGAAANRTNTLEDFRATASYYWHNEIGGTVNYFNTSGSADALLYADSRTFSPDSNGFTLQADWTPFGTTPSALGPRVNLRLGIQYTIYTKFMGATTNYDGLGGNASDNDTLRVFTWLAF